MQEENEGIIKQMALLLIKKANEGEAKAILNAACESGDVYLAVVTTMMEKPKKERKKRLPRTKETGIRLYPPPEKKPRKARISKSNPADMPVGSKFNKETGEWEAPY